MSGRGVGRVMAGVGVALGLMLLIAANAGAATAQAFTSGLSSMPDPSSITAGPDGNVWFTDASAIGEITTDGAISEYTAGLEAGDYESTITVGSDGALWFCEDSLGMGTPAIGRIDPATGAITNFPLTSNPQDTVLGPDGNIWYLGGDGATPAVGNISTTGHITPISLGTNSDPEAIAPGPDGDMWVLDDGNPYQIDQVVLGTSPATVNSYSTGLDPMAVLDDLTAGPDGDVWFTADEHYGKITPSGTITEVPQGTNGLQADGDPDEITPGPDGKLWFDDQYSGNFEVGSIDPATMMATEYELPTQTIPETIAFGSDGNLWVVQDGAIAQVTPSGTITPVPATSPMAGFDGDQLIAGPDGNLWFNDRGTKAIIKIGLAEPPQASTGAASAITSSSATVSATVTPATADTTVSFQYGSSPTTLAASTAPRTLGASTTPITVTAQLTGLTAGTTVYYRVVATNPTGTADGSVLSFGVPAATPTTTTPTTTTPTTTTTTPTTTTPTPAPPRTTTTASFGNQTLTLTTPAQSTCVAKSAGLAIRFTSKAASTKRPKLTFGSASFFIDAGIARRERRTITVGHKRRTVTVTVHVANAVTHHSTASVLIKRAGLSAGLHTLRVVVAYRETVIVGGHPRQRIVDKTLIARVRIC